MDFCDEEHEVNHELGFIGDDSHQKHFIASSTQPILNCSDKIIQQNHGFAWGSLLRRLQTLTSVNSIGGIPFYSSNLRLSLEPYFVLNDDGKSVSGNEQNLAVFFLSVW